LWSARENRASGSRWRSSLLVSILSYVAIFGALVLISVQALKAAARYRRRFLVRTEERVESLYLGIRPERFWRYALLGAAGGALLLALISGFRPALIGVGAVLGFLSPRIYLGYMARERRRKFDAQLLDALRLMASAMKAGMSLVKAMEHVNQEMGPPLKQEFDHALQENRVGKPIVQALRDMKDRVRSQDLSTAVNAIGIAHETGGVLSDLLLRIAETIRARDRVRAQINTLSAQGRLQGIFMILVPWVMGFLLLLLDPDMMRPLFTTTLGQMTLMVIAVLEFVGWVVIRRLVDIDV